MRRRFLLLAVAALLIGLFFFFWFSFPPPRETSFHKGASEEQLEAARAYLIGHFDPEVGLVYESEDKGSNALEHYPALEGRCFCENTFWVYSDNLFVYNALKNHNENIATIIEITHDGYVSIHNQSGCYEVLFGEDIPDQIHDSRPYLVDEIAGKYVFISKFNRPTLLGGGDVSSYADVCIYKALDRLWTGDRQGALTWFDTAHDMFDGRGVKDATALNPDASKRRYDTYKLALILYASRILEVNISDFKAIEDCLWNAQNESTGGIIAHVSATTGKPKGSANAETTALSLLVYEDNLIQSLMEKARWAERLSRLNLLLIFVVICAFVVSLALLVRRGVFRGISSSVISRFERFSFLQIGCVFVLISFLVLWAASEFRFAGLPIASLMFFVGGTFFLSKEDVRIAGIVLVLASFVFLWAAFGFNNAWFLLISPLSYMAGTLSIATRHTLIAILLMILGYLITVYLYMTLLALAMISSYPL